MIRRRTFLLGLATLGWAATRWRPAGAQGLRGRVLLPGSPDYEAARHVYNPRLDVRPAAIAYPVDPADVAAALDYARSNGWPVAIRCGGHSYEGFSLGRGLVLDVSQLNAVQIEETQAVVGAGCRQRAVTDALFAAGRALPNGTCPGVGVSGYTLGGGYGLASRAWGLGCDHLLEAELVTAHGDILTVDGTAQPELFWALRGAGGGHFGVVTRLRFATHEAPQAVLIRRAWDPAHLDRVLQSWWDLAPRADERLTLALSLAPQGLRMTGLFLGPEGELPRLDWAPTQEAWQKPAPLSELVAYLYGRGRDAASPFLARSDFLSRRPPTSVFQALLKGQPRLILDPHGGAIARGKATCYGHRDYPVLLQTLLYYQPAQAAQARAWLGQASKRLEPHVSGQAYQNYPDPVRGNWAQAAYGSALPRLRSLQARLDPTGLFGRRL